MGKEIIKKTKWFISIKKEKLWLEEMALKGYKLCNMVFGIRYTFEKIEPSRLVYEMDRFNLPKSPSLGEIKEKEEAIEVAKELGWEIVVHDEDMNYYFCKEYIPEDSNQLYHDLESREIRAQKYRNRYQTLAKSMIAMALAVNVFLAIFALFMWLLDGVPDVGFYYFSLGYTVFCLGFTLLYDCIGEKYYKEFMMTEEEWLRNNTYKKEHQKKVKKVFFQSKSLQKYLTKESENGWHIYKFSAIHYLFEKEECRKYQYIMDSKALTNKRIKSRGEETLTDKKDWMGMNNAWQVQSVKDAESLGWEFVSAYGNNMILYRGAADKEMEQLNSHGKMPLVGAFAYKVGTFLFICGSIGFVVGLCFGFLQK